MMTIGKMDAYGSVQSRAAGVDSHGEENAAFADVAACWAAIEPLGGRELYNARQVLSTASHRITLNYDARLAAIKPSWRFLYGGVDYNILSVRLLPSPVRPSLIELICELGGIGDYQA